MINFFKSLFSAKPQRVAAPQPKPTEVPTGLLDGLENQINEIKKVATDEEKTMLDQLLNAVQQNDLPGAAKQFYALSQLTKDWHLANGGVLLSSRISKLMKDEKLGLLGKESIRLEKNSIVGAITQGLGNVGAVLKGR